MRMLGGRKATTLHEKKELKHLQKKAKKI